jgi:hypothetical protein
LSEGRLKDKRTMVEASDKGHNFFDRGISCICSFRDYSFVHQADASHIFRNGADFIWYFAIITGEKKRLPVVSAI